MASEKRSRVGPWLLVDTVVGWELRGEHADRLAAAEHEAALARHDAAVARYERDRIKARRAVRMTSALTSASDGELTALPGRLRDAATRRPEPEPPPPPPAAPRARTSVAARPAGFLPAVATEQPPPRARTRREPTDVVAERALIAPHLRVLHLGAAARFVGLAPHTPVDPARWRDQLADGADLVVVEVPAGTPDWDPLQGELPALLRAAADASIPTVRIAVPGASLTPGQSPATGPGPGHATLELSEGSGAGDAIVPSVDTTLYNPVGWRLRPALPVVAVANATPGSASRTLLEGFDPPITLVHAPDLSVPKEVPGAARRVGEPTQLRAVLGRAGVLLDHPDWRGDGVEAARTWNAALACGVPVVTIGAEPPAEVLAAYRDLRDGPLSEGGLTGDGLPPGVLVAEEADAVEVVHRLLVDTDRRERLAIAGRRWALGAVGRDAVFRRILDHLDVPAPAPPRVTVLLATNRPEQLEHALDSVARQTQPGVEVSLVLHGRAFDGVDVPDRGVTIASVLRAPDRWLLGDVLNAGLDAAGGQLVAKMDDDDHYGPEHLRDLVAAWHYSGADVVGKRVEFVHLAQRGITIRRETSRPERDRPHVGGPTLLASRELLRAYRFLRLPNRVDSTLYERVRADRGRVYGTHSRDVVLERHGDGHAWQADDDTFLAEAIDQRDGLALGFASSDPDAS